MKDIVIEREGVSRHYISDIGFVLGTVKIFPTV